MATMHVDLYHENVSVSPRLLEFSSYVLDRRNLLEPLVQPGH